MSCNVTGDPIESLGHAVPDELWPYLFELEFLEDGRHILTDGYSRLAIPGSTDPRRRTALLDVHDRLRQLKHPLSKAEEYINSLIERGRPLVVDDVTMINALYEILWADGDLEEDDSEKWLSHLVALEKLDSDLGDPLKHLHWRIVRQSQILKGYVQWQTSAAWQSSMDAESQNSIQPEGLIRLSDAWDKWFLSPLPQPDALKTVRECFLGAIRSLGPSSTYYYAAVEGSLLTNSLGFSTKGIQYWDEEIARRSNDVARIISNRLNSIIYASGLDRKKSWGEDDLFWHYRNQMLLERIALRYWQLDGFVRSVANYAYFSIKEISNMLRASSREWNQKSIAFANPTRTADDKRMTKSDFRLSLFKVALFASPWGWPYGHASRDSISNLWLDLGSLLAQIYTPDVIALQVDDIDRYLRGVPDSLIYRNPFITLLDDLLGERHIETVKRYTDVVLANRTRIGDPTKSLSDFWESWVSVSEPDSVIMKVGAKTAVSLVEDIRDSKGFVTAVLRMSTAAIANELLETLIDTLLTIERENVGDPDRFTQLYEAIIEGIINRVEPVDIRPDLIEKLKCAARDNDAVIKNKRGLEYATPLIGIREPSSEEDSHYLDKIIAYIDAKVGEASEVNRSRWVIGTFAFPFSRPIRQVASSSQVSAIVDIVQRLSVAAEPTMDEYEGIFQSIGQFFRGVRVCERTNIIRAVANFASAPKKCMNHSKIFSSEMPMRVDGSLLALSSLREIVLDMTPDQLGIVVDVLRSRDTDTVLEFVRYSAPIVSAAAIEEIEPECGEWAQMMALRILFSWDRFPERDRYVWLTKFLTGIPSTCQSKKLGVMIARIEAWLQSVGQRLDTHHYCSLSYHIGRLKACNPDDPALVVISNQLSTDPRNSVRRSFVNGTKIPPRGQ